MIQGGEVHVRIAGVVCRLGVEPPDFAGWGVFQPTSHRAARLVRAATMTERQRYLRLFPAVRLILCERQERHWLALPAHQADRRFRIEGLVPVLLVEEAQPFDVIESRFEGACWWFDRADERRDPGAAAYLRRAWEEMVRPDELDRPGLTAEERGAYALRYRQRLEAEAEARRDRTETQLRAALAHAGAEFLGYLERPDSYRVEYVVDGRRHVSVVARTSLDVHTAGICLSGRDQDFDLQSLVGVIREGQSDGGIVGVGPDNAGMDEDLYWDVHPPPPGS
jgi:hypothetical protein